MEEDEVEKRETTFHEKGSEFIAFGIVESRRQGELIGSEQAVPDCGCFETSHSYCLGLLPWKVSVITEESKVETAATRFARENGTTTGEINWDLVQLTVGYLLLDHVVRGVGLIPGLPRDFLLMLGVVLSFGLFWYALSKEPWLRSNLGLTWKQKSGSLPWSLASVLVLLAVGVYAAVVRDIEVRSPLLNLHHAIAGPIAEELAYRGAALAALCCAFGSRGVLWPLVITSSFFVWAHAPIRDGAIWADLWRISYFFSIGIIQGAMRLKSGSLLFPVIGHMALNGAITVGFLLRR